MKLYILQILSTDRMFSRVTKIIGTKADLADKEEVRTGLISREVIRRQAEMIRRKQAVKDKLTAEKTERERKFGQ